MELRTCRPRSASSVFSQWTAEGGRTHVSPLKERLFLFLEIQRCRVHAVAEPCWLRTIRENVPEVGGARATAGFGARHAVSAVGVLDDAARIHGRPKAGPSGAGFEL